MGYWLAISRTTAIKNSLSFPANMLHDYCRYSDHHYVYIVQSQLARPREGRMKGGGGGKEREGDGRKSEEGIWSIVFKI